METAQENINIIEMAEYNNQQQQNINEMEDHKQEYDNENENDIANDDLSIRKNRLTTCMGQ